MLIKSERTLPRTQEEFVSHAQWTQKAHRILEQARNLGASDARVSLSQSQSLNVEVRTQRVEHLGFEHDRSLSITVYRGQQSGSTSASDWSDGAITRALEMAYRLSEFAEPDACIGLADASVRAQPRDLKTYCPWDISLDTMIESARTMERASQIDARVVNSEGASVSSSQTAYLYADSRGRSYFDVGTVHSLQCSSIAQDASGLMRGSDYTIDCRPECLELPEEIGRRAGQMAVDNLGGRPIKTQRAPVVLDSLVAASYWATYCQAIRGRLLYRNETFLGLCQGQTVFPKWVQLKEDPWRLHDRCASWFDEEGMPTRPTTLVHDGVVQQYLLDLYSARRLKLAPTGHGSGIHRCFVTPTHPTREALLKEVGTGLLVTDFMGGYPNYITGDYSRGVSGFWFEDGVIQFPVKTVTIAGNLKDLFQGCIGMSADLNMRPTIVSGSVAIEGFTIAGL